MYELQTDRLVFESAEQDILYADYVRGGLLVSS